MKLSWESLLPLAFACLGLALCLPLLAQWPLDLSPPSSSPHDELSARCLMAMKAYGS